ncbi:GTPase Era [Ectothiorhodospira sp. A-7Y]|nr:GTPase Era [Ectothiorhodospira lacustris]MCG5500527.1 GTPase Era [Ectothiorhodospira lacustris]MCG5509400.1 GTPase Era [Ectothiorhodospira lacustris]MCG5521454.1 GTPase Era [Ectothiorhodospira lacustris]
MVEESETMAADETPSRCGYVAIVGRPNVGKSTLLNQLVGEKIAAASRKPQTTRHRIRGMVTRGADQLVLVDTPGVDPSTPKLLGKVLNRTARATLDDVDAVVFVIEAGRWEPGDEQLAGWLAGSRRPVVLVINKVDRLKDKDTLLPFIDQVRGKLDFHDVVPLSALRGVNVNPLVDTLIALLPEGPHLFPDDEITDRSQRFRVSEVIREQLLERLGQEVPYATSVDVETWEDTGTAIHIGAVIWVERDSQKSIVVGKGGRMIKAVGTGARHELEDLLQRKVMLKLWVKLREGWQGDIDGIRRMGIDVEP